MESDGFTRRTGRGMLYAAWAVVLGLLMLLFGNLLERRENPNRELPRDGHEVRLQRNARGHYVAEGFIDGQPVTLLLDTGATLVSVPAAVARRIGLKAGAPLMSTTANGTITTYATRLARVRIGAIELHDVRGAINPAMEGDEVLLGMSFLKQLELVQRGDQLLLRR